MSASNLDNDSSDLKLSALATSECIEVASFVGSGSLSAEYRYKSLVNQLQFSEE